MNKTKSLEESVKKCYSTWGKTYYDDYYGKKAPYPPVHREFIRRLILDNNVKHLLDAGCGPASFLRDMIGQGLDLYGFDLTPEMVEEAKRIFADKGLAKDHIWQGSVLDPASFRFPTQKKSFRFDACISFGVLPHIDREHTPTVFQNLHAAVKPNGLVIVEARNQLFALFTLNRYSYEFFMDELIGVKKLKAKAGGQEERLTQALVQMGQQFRLDLPPVRKGKAGEPGYDEVLSLTHNPLVLKEEFTRAGFKEVQTLFYHFHCVPPMLSSQIPDLFLQESVAMENPYDWRGHFMASAFFLVGKRA